jgi:peptidoglycan hydrolase-like protein with peptidoglycan-binding domain
MKTKCITVLLLLAAFARGDELTKKVQTELKSQGFFYTDVNGVNGPETAAAIKRYQIRNGLEVTGTLSKETLEALGVQSDGSSAPAPGPGAAPVERESPAPPNLRKDTPVESDRNFLKKPSPRPSIPRDDDAESPRSESPRTPNATIGGSEYTKVFSRTPYAAAPLEVQQSTLRRAQKFLAEQGFYHERVDGNVGPGTEEAILGYQRFIRLPLTGRLDMETLSAMRMLPGDKGGPPVRREGAPATGTKRVYRGVWVN